MTKAKSKLFDKDFALTAGLYVLTAFILSFYCAYACAFEKKPHAFTFTLMTLGCFGITLWVRTFGLQVVKKREPKIEFPIKIQIKNPWHYLFLDMASWLFAGTLVIIFGTIFFKADSSTNTKISLWCFCLGIFYSRFLSLKIEKEMISSIAKVGYYLNLPPKKFISLSTKYFTFILICLTIISGIALLLFYKDMNYIQKHLEPSQETGSINAFYEFFFVIGVLFSGAFVVAYQYRDNFKVAMNYQLKAFKAVENGNYNVAVPAVTSDEFSLLAIGTNRMITSLKEKDKIKAAFGKYMSPAVANAILESEVGTALEGRLVEAVIMFIDIRDYTAISEKKTPQEVVKMLNAYFSLIVKCVHKHHGVVDKYIGDAAMVVFGLDEKQQAKEQAIQTAFEIIRTLPELNEWLKSQKLPLISIGIGIHSGPAIAGNIGSDERLEYTVIGDAVNIASRLQNLNKDLHTTLTVSEPIYKAASAESQALLSFKGMHPLKGKSHELPIYSL